MAVTSIMGLASTKPTVAPVRSIARFTNAQSGPLSGVLRTFSSFRFPAASTVGVAGMKSLYWGITDAFAP